MAEKMINLETFADGALAEKINIALMERINRILIFRRGTWQQMLQSYQHCRKQIKQT